GHGVPARRLRNRARLGIAARHVASGGREGPSGAGRHAQLRRAPRALRVAAGHGRPRDAADAHRAGAVRARLVRRGGDLGHRGRGLVGSACRTALASLPLMGSCWLALALWPARQSLLLDVAWLAATIVVGGGAFWIASVALGMPERTVLLRLYSRRERGLTDA